jgi:hypothetical protein
MKQKPKDASGQELVLTPGGFRHPSLVHKLAPGQEMVIAWEALEVYKIDKCSDYPATRFTAMKKIALRTAGNTGTPAAPGSGLNGYRGLDNSQHVNFIDSSGHVRELYLQMDGAWVDNDRLTLIGTW